MKLHRANTTITNSCNKSCETPHCTSDKEHASSICGRDRILFPTSLCGVLVFGCALPPASSRLPPPASSRSPPHTHTQLTHNTTYTHTHTTLSHTTYSQHNSHTQNLLTHTTHSLTHTAYSHTHNSRTHTHNLHTHTTYSHITYYRYVHSAWQAWHLATLTCILRGRHGTYGDIDLHFVWQAWHLWHWAVSGGALRWSPQPFAWQVWHLVAWTFT